MPKSGGLLRDQQTLNETTVGHDTSCEISLTGKAFGKRTGKPGFATSLSNGLTERNQKKGPRRCPEWFWNLPIKGRCRGQDLFGEDEVFVGSWSAGAIQARRPSFRRMFFV